ncbi:hypothetical protein FHL15_001208 [Xylaria flabelliformis]|uniref:Uncharacterized protein n=1 Tax=Xylaria flabelliformis TaxID=2512241 RepID=A0A553ICR9_9PEZI|nr:hypothetical protein FHL15_001208 [Xylaria flabelliformis]
MRSNLLPLLPVAAASVVPRQYFSFGNYFSTGPTASGTFIIDATTTLVLPALNSPHNGNLGLWPGMGMDDGDLVQGLAISTVGIGSPCNLVASEVKWANFYEDKYNPSTGKTDQTVSVNGNVVSTLSTSSGRGGLGWGTAMECQQANCGTVPTHHYVDTKITMSAPNPNYKNTLALNGASGNFVTADGGTTWTVSDITINQYTYT